MALLEVILSRQLLEYILKSFNDDMVIPSLFVDRGHAYNDHAFDFDKWVYSAGVQFRVMTIAPSSSYSVIQSKSYGLSIVKIDLTMPN